MQMKMKTMSKIGFWSEQYTWKKTSRITYKSAKENRAAAMNVKLASRGPRNNRVIETREMVQHSDSFWYRHSGAAKVLMGIMTS